MKVKFIKNHLNYKANEAYNLEDNQAEYLIRCGVAEEFKEKKSPKKKATKEKKIVTQTK